MRQGFLLICCPQPWGRKLAVGCRVHNTVTSTILGHFNLVTQCCKHIQCSTANRVDFPTGKKNHNSTSAIHYVLSHTSMELPPLSLTLQSSTHWASRARGNGNNKPPAWRMLCSCSKAIQHIHWLDCSEKSTVSGSNENNKANNELILLKSIGCVHEAWYTVVYSSVS